jgi:tetratricopeptide (TPR) repeat protein
MIELRQQRQQNDLTKINTAVKHARSALLLGKRLTPMNYVVDLPLVISYREEIGLYQNNRERALRARDMMFATGEAGVKLFDRQPQLLRELLIQNIMWERFGEAERIYYLLERLEPHSADVHLLHADLLFAQGKVVRAVEETNVAVGLDPTFGEAYALQAHYKYKVAERIILTAFANRQHADPAEKSPVPKEVRILIADVCTLYSRARVNKEQMYPLFRYEFCLALLLLGENPVAIAEGKQLRDTPYFDRLCNKIMLIYNIKGQLKQGLKLVESLKEV